MAATEANPDATSVSAPELVVDDADDAVELPDEILASDAVETATATASIDPDVVKDSVVVAYESFSANASVQTALPLLSKLHTNESLIEIEFAVWTAIKLT